MQDLIFLAIAVAFFAIAAGFVRLCDRMLANDGQNLTEADLAVASASAEAELEGTRR